MATLAARKAERRTRLRNRFFQQERPETTTTDVDRERNCNPVTVTIWQYVNMYQSAHSVAALTSQVALQ